MDTQALMPLLALEDLAEGLDYALVGPIDSRLQQTDTGGFPWNTVCHLGRDFGDGLWRGGSGVLIGPRLVLTAGHCVYSHRRGGPPTRIRVAPGRSGPHRFPHASQIARRYLLPREYLAGRTRRDFDYGLILLPRGFPGIRRFLPLLALGDRELRALMPTALVTVAGYPADKPPGTLWHHSERLKGFTPRRLLYSVDTCPGHSGSPIWYRPANHRQRCIIGVHTSGILDARGRSHGCAPGTVMAPPHMSNSGVRITQEVLRRLRTAGPSGARHAGLVALP